LLGDVLYGAKETSLMGRPALHAYTVTFVHPTTHERVTFRAEHPQDFAKALILLDPSISSGQVFES
jgi:23S rRNA pseudouridine1911/1915/1917 synthase